MSSSQIPNLLSSRGGPRSRGRGRGTSRGGAFPSRDPAARADQSIQATDTDAAVSRLSAVSLGYWDDPFASYFVNGTPTRRLPIINRGTYTRTAALDILIHSFLSSSSTQLKQIISLGAGTDTRYFRLRTHEQLRHHYHDLLYHEFDFPTVGASKHNTVQKNGEKLKGEDTIFEEPSPEPIHTLDGVSDESAGWGLMSLIDGQFMKHYYCHPLDLRKLPSLPSLKSTPGVRSDVPTLIISECCLCYLQVDMARDVVKWFADKIPDLGILLYEPIGVDDAFGQMMVENLAARGLLMPTVQRYKTLEHQVERLGELGFKKTEHGGGVRAETIENIWQNWIPQTEKARVDALEGLDEVEEWQMLARHYAIVWGWTKGMPWDGQSPPSAIYQVLPANLE